MRKWALVLGLAVMAFEATAQEQECQADVKSHCKDATGKDVIACIAAAKDKFSDACKKKLGEKQAAWTALTTACQPDLTKVCGDKKVGDGTLGKCVKESEAKLSAGCKTAYAQLKSPVALPKKIPGGLKLPKKKP